MMPGRYRHYISKAREGYWPSDIVCVDCVSTLATTERDRVTVQEGLDSWHAVVLKDTTGSYRQAWEGAGQSAAAFWDNLDTATRKCRLVWLVSFQAARVWSLLRLWELLEDGKLQICDTDHRNSQAFRQRLRAYRLAQQQPLRSLGRGEIGRLAPQDSGYLVCEDPPNILRGRLHGDGKAFTWIDIRNHGIDTLGDVMPGMDTARWLARWTQRVCTLCADNGLTALKPTAGSQAMAAWRHSHLKESVYVHTDERATELEAHGYFGGRCEAVKIGVIPHVAYHVDFRSQYGWVCANCALPTRLRHTTNGEHSQAGSAAIDYASAIAEVSIATEEPLFPVRRGEEVIYPIGRYRTVLCGPELLVAVRNRLVTKVHAVAIYEMGYPLQSYANALYALRVQEERDGVPGSATWIKRLIVSLPGKLGQKSHQWVDSSHVMPQCMYGEWYGQDELGESIRYRSIGGLVQRDVMGGFGHDTVPAIAGFVTSYGRMRLTGAIKQAGWKNTFYFDTDSLIVNKEGYDRLVDSPFMQAEGLGALTLRATPQITEIRGVKYYVEDRSVVCAGVCPRGVSDLGDGRHYARRPAVVDQLRKGERPNSVVRIETYPRTTEYNLGTVLPDGRVVPFRLNEETT